MDGVFVLLIMFVIGVVGFDTLRRWRRDTEWKRHDRQPHEQ
jgi:hypothetical protein